MRDIIPFGALVGLSAVALLSAVLSSRLSQWLRAASVANIVT